MAETNIKKILSNVADLESRFIGNYKELKKVVETFKKIGYRIVLTQGVYDLIHEGHAAYLEKARSYGDLLIVGVRHLGGARPEGIPSRLDRHTFR